MRSEYLMALLATVGLWLWSRTRAGQVATVDAVGSAVEAWRTTRGLRNRNPGNIEWLPAGRAWRGQVGKEPQGRFGVYDTDANGVRAIGKQLEAYYRRGLVTVEQMISTWAPLSENATGSYISAVSRALGIGKRDRVSMAVQLPAMVAAIIRHENGKQPYALDDIARWVNS